MTAPYGLGETGQGLIMALLAMTVIFLIGALAIDLGLWLSERHGSQVDADFAVLAGAWEYLDPNATADDARNAAIAGLAANNEQGNATQQGIDVDSPCFNTGKMVSMRVKHETFSVFSAMYGVFTPEVGAEAKACAGATNAPPGIVPFEVDNDDLVCFAPTGAPKFGVLCPLDYGTPGNPNPREILDLTGSGDYCGDAQGGNTVNVIETGATGTCLMRTPSTNCGGNGPWYDCVSLDNVGTNQVINAVANRIANQPCDTGGATPGIDDREETVNLVFDTGDPATSVYQAKDCAPGTVGSQISPRLTNIIVLDNDPDPGTTHPVEAFAGFFIAGCHQDLLPAPQLSDLDRDCNPSGGPPYNVVYGEFVNLIVEDSGVGEQGPSTTLFSVALAE